jgi:glycerol-3-phosphate dehydrogenase
MPDPLSGTDNFEHHATQVLVVGSGPTGSTYAKKCVDAGIDTIMIDMGAQ